MNVKNDNPDFDSEIAGLLESIAADNELKKYCIKNYSGSVKGDGYLGIIRFVDICSIDESERKTLHLVVKTALKGESIRKEVPIAEAFQREIYMYGTVIPSMQEFLRSKGLPPFSCFAKCFKTNTTTNSEALILENLKARGFKLWERRKPMDEEHIEFVLKEYARLHAISFAMKDQDPFRFKTLTENMYNSMASLHEKGDFATMLTNQCNKIADLFSKSEETHIKEVFGKFTNEAAEFFKDISRLPKEYSVIVHGDCWTNNMLFKYDGVNDAVVPTEVCFIDFQIAKLAPPVLDVAYLFYTCSSINVLNNLQYYLGVYYSSLENALNRLGTNPEHIYPYSVFVQQWKELAKYGLVVSIIATKMMLCEPSEAIDFSGLAQSGQSLYDALEDDISNLSAYNERIKSIVVHLVENKLL